MIVAREKVDHGELLRVFELYMTALDELGIAWWIDYGTLLGAAREGGFIEWDGDVDLGVFAADRPRVIALQSELQAKGLRTSYHTPGEDGTPRCGDWFHVLGRGVCGVDTFFWHEGEDGLLHRRRYSDIDRHKGQAFPPDKLLPLQRLHFEGLMVRAPADLEWFAEWRKQRGRRRSIRGVGQVNRGATRRIGAMNA